jgi:predicted nucleic acid-binding protein
MEGSLDVIADTTFYIDLQRGRNEPKAWMLENLDARLVMTPVVYGELLVGQPDPVRMSRLATTMYGEIDFRTAVEFANVARKLRTSGQMIGANDLWIAAIAILYGLPVLTRNANEFNRIPRLSVISY